VSRKGEADVRLRADDDGVRVTVGEATFPFEELRATDVPTADSRSGSSASCLVSSALSPCLSPTRTRC
jgi:hypothetical protein